METAEGTKSSVEIEGTPIEIVGGIITVASKKSVEVGKTDFDERIAVHTIGNGSKI